MNYVSLASGIEAATVAAQGLGWNPLWFSEIEPFPCALLKQHYPEVENRGDMTEIKIHASERADIVIGGTPCQGFSVAGKRGGLDDPRSQLVWHHIKIAADLGALFVWENVPGVLSQNDGRDFATILRWLEEFGYRYAWRVLDAQYFGVPQRRRRVFLVGHPRDWRIAAAILFESSGLLGHPPSRGEKGEGVASLTATGIGTCGADDNQATAGHLISGAVSAKWAKGTGCPAGDEVYNLVCHQSSDIAHTLTGEGFDATEDGSGRGIPLISFDSKAGSSFMTSSEDNVSPTLRAMNGERDNGGGQVAIAFKAGQGSKARSLGEGNEISPMLGAAESGSNRTPCIALQEVTGRQSKDQNGPGIGLDDEEIMYTLQAGQQHGVACLTPGNRGISPDQAAANMIIPDGYVVRKLTPCECERLQGFPDGYTLISNYRRKLREDECVAMAHYLGISVREAIMLGATPDGPRYKALGNSMAVPVMRWLLSRIDTVLNLSHSCAEAA